MAPSVERTVKIVGQDDSLLSGRVSLSAYVTQPSATEESVAELGVTARNEGEIDARFYSGFWSVFGAFKSVEEGPCVLLLPRSLNVEIDPPGHPRERDLVFDSTDVLNVLSPGEESQREYVVCDCPDNDVTPPIGRYRFVNRYTLADGTKTEWGFTIHVERG